MCFVNERTIAIEIQPPRPFCASAAQQSSQRAAEVAAMFGLHDHGAREVPFMPRCRIDLPLPGSGVVFITGPSGAGKSTLLRSIVDHCRDLGTRIIDVDDLPPIDGSLPLIELVGRSLDEAASLLSLAGLAEAPIMLRTPNELSEGQRHRFMLARAMELARIHAPTIIVADEFGASLDRLTAKTIAHNVRRWVDREPGTPITFIAACANDDLLEALRPDVLMGLSMCGDIQVHRRT